MLFGTRSVDEKLLTTPDTIYRIASISKVIVAIAALMLYDDGLLDIYKDISDYLGYKVRNPYFPNDVITIEMLMTQTSSINDGQDDKLGYDGVNGPSFYVELKRLLTDQNYEYYTDKTYLNVRPGSTFCYSNFGCGILLVLWRKYQEYILPILLKKDCLSQMHLDAGFRIDDIEKIDMVASLYNEDLKLVRDKNLFQKVVFPRYTIGDNFRGPAGGLFISAIDLAKIMQMLMNNGIYDGKRYLKEDTVKNMKSIHWKTVYPQGLYKQKGLQLLILDDYGDRLYGHTGNAYGLRSLCYSMINMDIYFYVMVLNIK